MRKNEKAIAVELREAVKITRALLVSTPTQLSPLTERVLVNQAHIMDTLQLLLERSPAAPSRKAKR